MSAPIMFVVTLSFHLNFKLSAQCPDFPPESRSGGQQILVGSLAEFSYYMVRPRYELAGYWLSALKSSMNVSLGGITEGESSRAEIP